MSKVVSSAIRARTLRAGLVMAMTAALLVPMAIFAPSAFAAASANIDQCTNGKVSPLTLERCAGSSLGAVAGFKNWVNGNSNGQKSHWREGEFISYRARISGITAGDHTLRLHYDTVHGGKHALDYIGDFDATETTSTTASQFHANNNNPCGDLVAANQMQASQCTPSTPVSSLSVKPAALQNCGGSAGTAPAQLAGSFKMYGPTGSLLKDMTYVAQNTLAGQGQCSTTLDLKFSVPNAISTSSAIVIAWGGHIASQGDWGVGNSASAISGSPYHMALDLLDGASTGSQDRALATSAIFFTPSITTSLSSSAINVGGSVTDSATLTGASQNAGGTLTYTVYSDNTCTTSVASGGTKTVTNGIVPNSNAVTFNSSGTFYWQASYSGDSINQPAKSVCTSEVVVVGKAKPTIATSLSETSVAIGTAVTDSATLSGATSNAGGTVTYTVYSDDKCTTSVADGGTKTVTNGGVPDSDPVTFNDAGTFYWQAAYSGDTNNEKATSDCLSEIVTVNANTPIIGTTLSGTSVPVGTSVTDSATLSGATAHAGGTVTYTVYSDDKCTTSVADGGTKNVTDGVVPDSDPVTFNDAGTFYWQAAYSGDKNNGSTSSVCTDETLVVNPNTPSATTAQSLIPNDSATLSGATSSAGGTLEFDLFDPSDATCSGTAAFTQTVNVSGNGTYDTTNSSFVASDEGTWRWLVTYNGDKNNTGFTIDCGVEQFTIKNS